MKYKFSPTLVDYIPTVNKRLNHPYSKLYCKRGHKRTALSLDSNRCCRQCRVPYGRNYILKKNFGIDSIEYQRMFLAQNGQCAICGNVQTRRLAVDHDHKTGKVRALLCGLCNNQLGILEKANWLVNAHNYLKFHAAV